MEVRKGNMEVRRKVGLRMKPHLHHCAELLEVRAQVLVRNSLGVEVKDKVRRGEEQVREEVKGPTSTGSLPTYILPCFTLVVARFTVAWGVRQGRQDRQEEGRHDKRGKTRKTRQARNREAR